MKAVIGTPHVKSTRIEEGRNQPGKGKEHAGEHFGKFDFLK